MRLFHALRRHPLRAFLFIAVLLIASATSAGAAWEILPDPNLWMAPGSMSYLDDTWWISGLFMGYSGCVPFLVADDQSSVYIGHPATSWSYDRWLRYDSISETYVTLTSPGVALGGFSHCHSGYPHGIFVDGRVYAYLNDWNDLSVYDPQADQWTGSAIPIPDNSHWVSNFAADPLSGFLYWYNGFYSFIKMDPAVGVDSIMSFYFDIGEKGNVGLNIVGDRAYFAGGFFIGYSKGFPVPYGESSQMSTIVDLATETILPMSDVPFRTSIAGSVWDGESIHYFGMRLQGDGLTSAGGGSAMVDYYVYKDDIYHHLYDINTDSWQTFDGQYPDGCLPLSIVEQDGWLYGIFSCVTPNARKMQLYRTWLASMTTTTTTTVTTTSTFPNPDDDADDDDADDDDADDDDADDDVDDDSAADSSLDDDGEDDADDGGCGC